MLVEICDVFTDQESRSLRGDEHYMNIYEDYCANLGKCFSDWKSSRSLTEVDYALSKDFFLYILMVWIVI